MGFLFRVFADKITINYTVFFVYYFSVSKPGEPNRFHSQPPKIKPLRINPKSFGSLESLSDKSILIFVMSKADYSLTSISLFQICDRIQISRSP